MKKISSLLFVAVVWLVSGNILANSSPDFQKEEVVQRIAFGSCLNPRPKKVAIFDGILRHKPDVFVFLGDNIYGDTTDMELLAKKWNALGAVEGFKKLSETSTILATWDDHDYGVNDGGKSFPMRLESERIFLDFFKEPANSPRRKREGVYGSYVFGPPGKRCQILLLDTRSFRDELPHLKGKPEPGRLGWYEPTSDRSKSLLGEEQWKWLEEQLQVPADLRIIASSIQMLAHEKGMENWGNTPHELERLVGLLKKYKADHTFAISGDVHFAELSKRDIEGYPFYDFTSSGMSHTSKRWAEYTNSFRMGDASSELNAGLIEIDWDAKRVTLKAINPAGEALFSHQLALDELVFPAGAASNKSAASGKPNVIYILADDLGYGDLSCYGQKKIQTPNIDRLASEGMKFTDHYSGSTVCSPSRACLMTGQHPGRVHCRGNGDENSYAKLDPAMTTLPRLFKNAGYATGAFGKWGLGDTTAAGAPNPLTHGFDTFSGWKNQTIAHTYYPKSIVRDGQEEPLRPGTHIHSLIMDDAFSFIEKNAESGTPFFCYIPTAIPHAAMHAPADFHEKWRKVFPQFDKKIGKYKAGPDETCPPVQNPVAAFAAMMETLDGDVGCLLALLKKLGIDDNTLILFASDNGSHNEGGHDPDFWDSNGPFKGHKRDLYEGGIRSPFLARWPARTAPGSVSAHPGALWDVLPTMAELTGQPVPEQVNGLSFLPTLIGESATQKQPPYLYWEHPQTKDHDWAVRTGPWKGVFRGWKNNSKKPTAPKLEIYNLDSDPGETTDLAAAHPEIIERLQNIRSEAHRAPVAN